MSLSMATITSLSSIFLGIDNDTSPVSLPDWQGAFVLSLVAGFVLLVSVLVYISPPPQKNYRLVLVTITGALDIDVGPIKPDTAILGDYEASFDEATSALIEDSLTTCSLVTSSDDIAVHSDNDDDKTLATITTEASSCEDIADQANASFISSSETLVSEPSACQIQASIGELLIHSYTISFLMSCLVIRAVLQAEANFEVHRAAAEAYDLRTDLLQQPAPRSVTVIAIFGRQDEEEAEVEEVEGEGEGDAGRFRGYVGEKGEVGWMAGRCWTVKSTPHLTALRPLGFTELVQDDEPRQPSHHTPLRRSPRDGSFLDAAASTPVTSTRLDIGFLTISIINLVLGIGLGCSSIGLHGFVGLLSRSRFCQIILRSVA